MPRVTHARNVRLPNYRFRYATPVAKVIKRAPHASLSDEWIFFSSHKKRMDYSKLAFLFPLAVSLLSLYFSVKAWRQANRPIITLRVTSQGKAGNISIPLTLMIENTGNRPAINIRITVDSKVIKKNLLAPKTHVLTQEILRIFSEDTVIPVIGNGKTTSNSFGILSQDENCTWKSHGRFDVSLAYEDIDGRRYYQKHPILISDNDHFADGFWS